MMTPLSLFSSYRKDVMSTPFMGLFFLHKVVVLMVVSKDKWCSSKKLLLFLLLKFDQDKPVDPLHDIHFDLSKQEKHR